MVSDFELKITITGSNEQFSLEQAIDLLVGISIDKVIIKFLNPI